LTASSPQKKLKFLILIKNGCFLPQKSLFFSSKSLFFSSKSLFLALKSVNFALKSVDFVLNSFVFSSKISEKFLYFERKIPVFSLESLILTDFH